MDNGNGERKGAGREDEEEEEEEIVWLCSLSRAVTNRARAPSALEEVAVTLATIARRYGEPQRQRQQSHPWKQGPLPPELSGPEACMWHAPDGAMWGTGAREVVRVISFAAERAGDDPQLEIATLGCWRMWTLGVSFETEAKAPLIFVILPGSQKHIRSALDRVIERVRREEGEKEQRQKTRAFLCRTCYDSTSLLGRRGRAAATRAFLAMRFLDYERATATPSSFFGEVEKVTVAK